MSSSTERSRAPAGSIIYTQGETADCAYLLLQGTVELRLGQGDRMRVLTRSTGEMFGDLALIDDSPRPGTAMAVTDCELLAFSSRDLSDRIQSVDPLLRIVLTSLMARYSEAAGRARLQAGDAAPTSVLPVWLGHAAAARDVLSFEHEFRAGLERNEFELFFQPIIRLATGRLAGVEALMRWRHPIRGLLAPADFIPFAESNGLISEVTSLCLRGVGALFPAMKAAAERNAAHVERLFVSVNVSGIDLAQSSFAAQTVSALCDAGVEPEDVKLEVTESVLMQDAERCAMTLRNCRDQGMGIAIDDFGTGYSSLHYLNALPISGLKMDQSFCRSMIAEPGGRKIIAAIMHLGHDLGLVVIAEGVETMPQRDLLQAMGCDMGQGYLFGAPRDHAETLRLVEDWRADGAGRFASSPAVSPAA